jgi:transposase InsO family protein
MTKVFSRRIVGWRVANTLRAALALDALEEAAAGFHGEQVTLGCCGVRWCRTKDGDVVRSRPTGAVPKPRVALTSSISSNPTATSRAGTVFALRMSATLHADR